MKTSNLVLLRAVVCGAIVLLLPGCANFAMPLSWPWQTAQKTPSASRRMTPAERIKKLDQLAREARKLSPDEQETTLANLAVQVRAERDPLLRARIYRTAARFETPSAVAMMAEGVADSDPDVRIVASEALGEMGGDEALRLLSETLASDTNLDVRLAAARALGATGDPRARQPLRLALDDSDAAIRVRSVRSLERVTGESFGDDVIAWQDFLDGRQPVQQRESLAGWLRRLF